MNKDNWADGVSQASLVKALAERNETIGNLQNELGKALARIAELEAQLQTKQAWINDAAGALQSIRGFLQEDPPWMPIAPGKIYVDGLVTINFFEDRITVQHAENTPIMVYLEPDIRMCRKIQPAA